MNHTGKTNKTVLLILLAILAAMLSACKNDDKKPPGTQRRP